jgi:hypothetical protein
MDAARFRRRFVIDPNGRVVKQWSGYAPGRSGDRLTDAIDQALP